MGSDSKHRAQVDMLANVIYDLKHRISTPCYRSGNITDCFNAIAQFLPPILNFKLSKGSLFISGDSLTWLDFLFLEMVFFMEFLYPNIFKDFPYLLPYKNRVKDLPNLKEYFFSPKKCIDMKYTFNNKVAKINN